MKNLRPSRAVGAKKAVCTVSAAALMLGVSSAATIGLHFQDNYCGAYAYTGFVVTLTAFGVPPSSWENMTPMDTGYGACSGPLGYTLSETVDTTTSTNGLNPLPNGSLSVNWFGPTANYDPFAGYAGTPPSYQHAGGTGGAEALTNNPVSGEAQVYSSFIRDGINFGPPGGADNNQPGWTVDVTGLKSVFTNAPFVVEVMASSDSMQLLTNVFVVDVPGATTNTVSYPSTPPVSDAGSAPWVRGISGGLSTATPAMNTDHIYLFSAHPAHGGTGTPPTGFDNAGTLSGFIITDKPVISMPPHQVVSLAGDSVTINPLAIGVPPLSYQWRKDGVAIPGATNLTLSIATVTQANAGAYDLVVNNAYGAAVSPIITVGDPIQHSSAANVVVDTSLSHSGVNMGATWQATNSDGTTTRNGVLSFVAANTNGISVPDGAAFDGPVGTLSFWMRSAGTDTTANGTLGASLFCRASGNAQDDFILIQQDGPGTLYFQSPNSVGNTFSTSTAVSDNKWHNVALTFDSTEGGGAAIYIDGAQAGTNSNGGGSFNWPSSPLEIGYTTDPTYRNYNGLLDDIRYYSAVLSTAEIAAIHSSGAVGDAADLQFQFEFDTAPGGGIVLTWGAPGVTLQSAPAVTGPWTDLPSGVTSPYTIVPSSTQQFFRYQTTAHAPEAIVTNPYQM